MNQGQIHGHVPESDEGLIDESKTNAKKRDVTELQKQSHVLGEETDYRSGESTNKRAKITVVPGESQSIDVTIESASQSDCEKTIPPPLSSTMNAVEFCKLLGVLKHLPRAGWLRRQIRPCEPVAGHMYRMAVLAMCLERRDLDQGKCIKMALVHDMAESIVGDITPHCGVSAEEKTRRENLAMQRIATLLPQRLGDELYSLWREYEAQHTEESKVVKQLDRFDLIMQAFEYEQAAEKPKYLNEFYNSSSTSIKQEPVVSWMRQLLKERDKMASEFESNDEKIDKINNSNKSDSPSTSSKKVESD